MRKSVFLIFLLCFLYLSTLPARIDINIATLEELKELPITEEQAEDIYDYRYYVDYFRSIYQLTFNYTERSGYS